MEKAIDVFEGMNPEQIEATKAIYGPVLTSAGPGSGKTFILTRRAQYMIMQGIDPSQILLTTFTNKAANEIKERIVKVVGEEGKKMTVGTFHSICNRILRQYGERIGYCKTFTILDESDSEKIMKAAAKQYGIETKDAKFYIAQCKANLLTPAAALAKATSTDRDMANIYQAYQDELKRTQCMDFDDLLLNTVLLLENYTDVKQTLNKKWQYILLDEQQDSSYTDSRLAELLAGELQNIFFVGDDFQSIYGFRNADVNIMLNLKSRYPDLQWFNLSNNYRSTDTIVYGAKTLIDKNKNQLKKEIVAARGVKGAPIVQTKCKDQEHEAKTVATYIKMVHDKYKVPYKEIAVLYRMTYLSRNIEQRLMKEKIPYTLIGGTPFFCRAEVQDILSYLKLIVNDRDVTAFKRSVAVPKRGVGEKSILAIDEFARTYPGEPLSIREALNHSGLTLKGKAKTTIKEYAAFLDRLEEQYLSNEPAEVIKWLITELNYMDYLEQTYKDQAEVQVRAGNLFELVNVASEYESIEDLLVQASLYREDKDEDDDKVQLLTMHKSKGLEFKCVIVVGCSETICPHFKALDDPAQIEEERRLMYVAMTRAKDYLFMTYPSTIKAQGREQYVAPSRFLREIDKKYVHQN